MTSLASYKINVRMLFVFSGEVKTEGGAEEVETKELERKEIVCYWTCYL